MRADLRGALSGSGWACFVAPHPFPPLGLFDHRWHRRSAARTVPVVEALAGGDHPARAVRVFDEGRPAPVSLAIGGFRHQHQRIRRHAAQMAGAGEVRVNGSAAGRDNDGMAGRGREPADDDTGLQDTPSGYAFSPMLLPRLEILRLVSTFVTVPVFRYFARTVSRMVSRRS